MTAVIAVPRLENSPQTRAYHAVRQMRSDVRYAQLLAMQTQVRTRVSFDVALESYLIQRETGPGSWASVLHPSTKEDYQIDFNTGNYQGADITAAVLNAGTSVIFNDYGEPFDDGSAPLNQPAYVELNAKYRLNIRPQTGKTDIVEL